MTTNFFSPADDVNFSIINTRTTANADFNELNKHLKHKPATTPVLLPDLSEDLVIALQVHLENPTLLATLIDKMPKTDLHVHAEAGYLMNIELARLMAVRNGISFPEELVDKNRNLWKYRVVDDFMVFINDFLTISKLIQTPQDVEDAAFDYYKYCYENNVVFALPGISWVQCQDKMTFVAFNEAYNRALLRGMKEFGSVSVLRLRYYQERHVDAAVFNEMWEQLQAHPNGLITTIGLAGAEEPFPFEQFTAFFQGIKEKRLLEGNKPYFTTAHMEKHSDAKTIFKATSDLDWVAHGSNIADNLDYVQTLKAAGVRFEICPLSDTTVYPSDIPNVESHKKLKTLLDAGIVNLNSDDPGFFGGVNEVYQQVFKAKLASFSQLLQCTINGLMPAKPATMNELKESQYEFYKAQQNIARVGLLKVQFFQYYWKLLPMLVNLPQDIAKDLFAIDLKTPIADLKTIVNEFLMLDMRNVHSDLVTTLEAMRQCKRKIDVITETIRDETQMMYDNFISENHDDQCCLV